MKQNDVAGPVLFVTTKPLGDRVESIRKHLEGRSVRLLDFAADVPPQELPAGWERLPMGDYADIDALRRGVLEFLETWPSQPQWKRQAFDELFRRRGGYSVWWTQIASYRNARVGFVPQLKTLFALDAALRERPCERVLVHVDDSHLARAIISRCKRDGITWELLPGCAVQAVDPGRGYWLWLLRTIWHLSVAPARLLIRAVWARRAMGRIGISPAEKPRPAVVFSSRNASYARERNGTFVVWFWEELCNALRRQQPELRQLFLQRLGSKPQSRWMFGTLYHSGWPLQARLKNAVPSPDRYAALGAWLRALPRQFGALFRYGTLERSKAFRKSFEFAGADVSGLFIPRLREAVAGMAEWERGVAARIKGLRAVGNVSAMLVAEEFYPGAMQDLAAARELGIPTVGVQHGTIMPAHYVYTVPPGQIESAPIPDYFAAYGEFAEYTVSSVGSYPAERVWITGAPRFDYLVEAPPDRSQARRKLGLPTDKQVVLIATQTYPWFSEAVAAVIKAVCDRNDCLICVKVHPKRLAVPADEFQRMAECLGADNVVCFTDRFADLLAACDVLVSASSTTLLEALLLGRMAICVNFSDEPDRYPYTEEGGALAAGSEEQIKRVLRGLLDSSPAPEATPAQRVRFLQRHAGPTAEGRAAGVLADRILAVTDHEPPNVRAETVLDESTHSVAGASARV